MVQGTNIQKVNGDGNITKNEMSKLQKRNKR